MSSKPTHRSIHMELLTIYPYLLGDTWVFDDP